MKPARAAKLPELDVADTDPVITMLVKLITELLSYVPNKDPIE